MPYYTVPTVRALLDEYPLLIVHYQQVATTEANRREQEIRFRKLMEKLHSRKIINLNLTENLCSLLDAVREKDPTLEAYVLTDDRLLVQRLNAEGCWSAYHVTSYQDLKRQLRELNTKPRGLLLNAIQTLIDREHNTVVSADRINRAFLQYNRHIDLSFVVLENNLSMIIVREKEPKYILNVRRLQKIVPDLAPYLDRAIGIIQGSRK